MKKAFVTGGTGFLGSHLVDRLLEEGWEVHALVRKSSNLKWLEGKKVHYHTGDIVGDSTGLREGLRGVDVCFHVAGVILSQRPETYYDVNTQGTETLLESILEVNPQIQRVVIVSSLAAHGPGRGETPMTEEDDCHPITDYGRSKRDQELVALRYLDRLPITIIRPPAIYGPRDRQVFRYFWMVKKGVVILPGGGRKVVNLAYVQDVVTGLLLASEMPQAVGEIFFIGDGENCEWEEIAGLISQAMKRKVFRVRIPLALGYVMAFASHSISRLTGHPLRFNPSNLKNFLQANWALNIDKAKRLLGYRPATPLKKGIEETAHWYTENHWL